MLTSVFKTLLHVCSFILPLSQTIISYSFFHSCTVFIFPIALAIGDDNHLSLATCDSRYVVKQLALRVADPPQLWPNNEINGSSLGCMRLRELCCGSEVIHDKHQPTPSAAADYPNLVTFSDMICTDSAVVSLRVDTSSSASNSSF
jgi:hypothetical protein